MATAKAEAVRAAAIESTWAWYSPVGHLLSTVGLNIGIIATALCLLRSPTVTEALLVPLATLIFANFFEWFVHKEVMHRPRRFLRGVHDRHARRHHVIYTLTDMEMRSSAEWRFVLMSLGDFIPLMAVAAAIGWLVSLAFGHDIGLLVLAAEAAYVGAYELTHLSYHLPAAHPLRRFRLVARLSEHHARHHAPALMRKWNFNITVPLADYVLGTIAPLDQPDGPKPATATEPR